MNQKYRCDHSKIKICFNKALFFQISKQLFTFPTPSNSPMWGLCQYVCLSLINTLTKILHQLPLESHPWVMTHEKESSRRKKRMALCTWPSQLHVIIQFHGSWIKRDYRVELAELVPTQNVIHKSAFYGLFNDLLTRRDFLVIKLDGSWETGHSVWWKFYFRNF